LDHRGDRRDGLCRRRRPHGARKCLHAAAFRNHHAGLGLVAIAGAAGRNLDSAIAYEAGRRGGRAMVGRYGRWRLLTTEDLDRAERFLDHYDGAAALIGRVLPGIRSFIALPAGVARMPLLRFRVYSFMGSLPRCRGLACLGKVLAVAGVQTAVARVV